jgi:hypothetical protein
MMDEAVIVNETGSALLERPEKLSFTVKSPAERSHECLSVLSSRSRGRLFSLQFRSPVIICSERIPIAHKAIRQP